jgi:cell wall assembly regulator SMI1
MREQDIQVTVSASWSRIEQWLDAHARPLRKSLAKGASPGQIQRLEAKLGTVLPDVFKESLAVHDGQKQDADLIPDDGIGSFYFLRSKDCVAQWKDWNLVQDAGEFDDAEPQPAEGIARCWWNRAWIPFASNGGDSLCLDLAPAAGGKSGQIILVRHDEAERRLMAGSFDEWLAQLADAIEAGGIDYLLEE